MKSITENKLKAILQASRKGFIYVAIFSFLINLLMLTVPIYMLQIFDRVLSSGSYDTLLYLTLIAIIALVVYGILEIVRGRIVVEISHWMDNQLGPRVLSQSVENILSGDVYGYQALRDVANIRGFLSGSSVFAFLDMPWVPIYILVVFLLHITLGVIALLGAVALFILAVLNEIASSKPLQKANQNNMANQNYVNSALKNAENMQAMGMVSHFIQKWFMHNEIVLNLQTKSSQDSGVITSISKFVRLVLQLLILSVGAYYVIKGELTPGAMIAASIITARALAPLEQSIGAWKYYITARQAYFRIKNLINAPDLRFSSIELPKPKGVLECDKVIYVAPGGDVPLLQGIQFKMEPGETLAVIGNSGAGKSTLGRLILGVWPATRGDIRLDGANVYTWNRTDFGYHVGYLPQDTGLFDTSIKENIACMNENAKDQDIIAAAQLAGAHDMILRLPHGYDTPATGFHLSGGQARRVALARALYGSPCLVVLDEPETNLDNEGEAALLNAITTLKNNRAATLIVISRHPGVVKLMDKVLVLLEGKMQAFGATESILPAFMQKREN